MCSDELAAVALRVPGTSFLGIVPLTSDLLLPLCVLCVEVVLLWCFAYSFLSISHD